MVLAEMREESGLSDGGSLSQVVPQSKLKGSLLTLCFARGEALDEVSSAACSFIWKDEQLKLEEANSLKKIELNAHISKVSFPVRKWWKVACWGSRSHNATAVFFGSFQRLINPSLAHKVLYQAKRINKVVDFLPFDLNNVAVAEANKACDRSKQLCKQVCVMLLSMHHQVLHLLFNQVC